MTTCKNCSHEFEGNFCNNCGQKAKTARLDWKYLSDEAKYTFLHFNGGLAFTLKQLVTRPGHAIREFVEGKRVHHYKPILLLFVLAGLYGFLMHRLDMSGLFKLLNPGNNEALNFQIKIFDLISSHYSLLEVLLIPIFSFASWLAFRKFGYNYIENIFINCFIASLRILFNIATFPLMLWAVKSGKVFELQMPLALIGFGLTIWAYCQIYKRLSASTVIFRMLLMFAVAGVIMFLLMIGSIVMTEVIWPGTLPRTKA